MAIVKQLNVYTRSFTDLLDSDDDIESNKLSFHIKKLIGSNIVTKSDKNYILTEFGLKALQFIEVYESKERFSVILEEKPAQIDKLTEKSPLLTDNQIYFDEKSAIRIPDRPAGLPAGCRTFENFVGKNSQYMEEKYCLSLPKPIEKSSSPLEWVKIFNNPFSPLFQDTKAFSWLEDRLLKLAYGSRGLQDFGIMDASLTVPPLGSIFFPLQEALLQRSKSGLFATTGQGKSRILLYLASWWIREYKTQVIFIENPRDISVKEWEDIHELFSKNISGSRNNPRWLIIIEDLHLVPKSALDPIRRLINGANVQTWSILIAFTESTFDQLKQNQVQSREIFSTIQEIKRNLLPLEMTHYLNLSKQWIEWKPFFHEWIQWVALDVLVNLIPWEKRFYEDYHTQVFNSPWALVASLGFLRLALNNLQTMSNNLFPLILYGTISQLYLLRGEQGIEESSLLKLFNKVFEQKLLVLVSDGDWRQEITTLVKGWTDPEIRLIPPLQYSLVAGSLKKEPIISFYHQEWAKEVGKQLFQMENFVITIFNLFKGIFPAVFNFWQQLENSPNYHPSKFLQWLPENTRYDIDKTGQLILVHLKIEEIKFKKLTNLVFSPNLIKKLTQQQLLNWSFIKSVVSNFKSLQ